MGRNASAVAAEGVKEGEGTIEMFNGVSNELAGTIFVVEWIAPERVVGVEIT
jgi:hypothetical protein